MAPTGDFSCQVHWTPTRMSTSPDLSGLSDAELRAIELADNEKLNELALRIGRVKSTKPS